MSNPWINHLKQVRQANPKLSYKECMVKGKQSYKKTRKVDQYMFLVLCLKISVK